MKLLFLNILLTTTTISCHSNLLIFFQKLNNITIKFNAIAAEIAWESSVNPGNPELSSRAANYQRQRIAWEEKMCGKLAALENRQLLNETEARMTYLMCRGPKFTFDEARITSALYEELQSIYTDAEVCIPYDKAIQENDLNKTEDAILNYISTVKRVFKLKTNEVSMAAKLATDEKNMESPLCLKGESDFEDMMRSSRNEVVLRWLWLVWRRKVGPPMKEPYRKLVIIENRAARRNGYTDIGAAWRDELEIPNLRTFSRHLYNQIKPLYSLLHGVVRFFLRKAYGDVVPERGAIPAHLLGNIWSQNWESIADLIIPETIDLDRSIKHSNWTTLKMVKHAEDFYLSLGLPAMTDTFWRKSIFARENSDTRCHGTAADMFQNGDYRLLYCSRISAQDFYVLHHEMGHIQYYMAYEKQPGIFRQANSALHETIGDTIMYGVLTSQHLYRLGLINDSVLYLQNTKAPMIFNNGKEGLTLKQLSPISSDDLNEDEIQKTESFENFKDAHTVSSNTENSELDESISADDILLLKQALNKLPQIPFSLAVDEYRWKYFEGGMNKDSVNEEFWDLALELQGITPPELRDEDNFDAGAKYHVPDNTPFIRYFFSSFLQHQLFESLCKASVFGRLGVKEDLPDSISMNRCDIYGSRTAGKLLKDLMSRGHSQHWREILQATVGTDVLSASALERYYQPLRNLLVRLVRAHRIPIGW